MAAQTELSANRSGMARVIAFMNQKGGVGKTTTTVNLAAAFARAGRPTLVVDLDPQAHASLHLGVDTSSIERSVYDVLIDSNADVDAAIHRTRENLHVLPAQTDLAGAETELALSSDVDRQRRLEHALARLQNRYEFVLIDCPPSLGQLTINGLVAAREVIMPMQAHFLALHGVSKLLETVSLVTQSLNPRLRVAGVVLCMHEAQSTHTKEVVADLEQFFDQQRENDVPWRFARVLRPVIRRNIKLAECPSFGQTIFEYAPIAPGAEDYAALANALLQAWDAMLAKRSTTQVETKPATSTPAQEDHPEPNVGVSA